MGKLITFWSPYKGRAGVTAGMCAISAMFGMLHPELEIAISHLGQEEELLALYQGGQFSEEGKKELSGKFTLASKEAIFDLFTMTPYFCRTSEQDKTKLYSLDSLECSYEFEILVYKKS